MHTGRSECWSKKSKNLLGRHLGSSLTTLTNVEALEFILKNYSLVASGQDQLKTYTYHFQVENIETIHNAKH